MIERVDAGSGGEEARVPAPRAGTPGATLAAGFLEYVDLLFGVALRFTGDAIAARRLIEKAYQAVAWQAYESGDGPCLKSRLLKQLRVAYLSERDEDFGKV